MALPNKYGIDKKINSMEGLSAYENGGKGSGNFGHAGRPGKKGGSSSGGFSSGEKETDFKSEYKVGDEFTKGGTTYKVVDGKNGPHAVSLDGETVTTLPDQLRHEQTKMIEGLFDTMRDEGIPSTSPRAVAAKETYSRIQGRAIEKARKGLEASRAPEFIKTEVERFLKKVETTDASKSVESYHKTSTGGLKGWAKGNGGLGKPQPTSVQSEVKELVAELDSLYDRYKIMSTPKGFRK